MERKQIAIFLVITVVLSSCIDAIWILNGDVATQSGISYLLMFMPSIATLFVKLFYYKKKQIAGVKKCKFKYVWIAILIPAIYIIGSYAIYWLLHPECFTRSFTGLGDVPAVTMIIMLFLTIVTAFGEEIGWRGILLPLLMKVFGKKKGILWNGIIWSVWHWPLIIAGLYGGGLSVWYQIPVITINFIIMTVIMSILRLRSGSVWPAVLLHAFHNFFDQVICGSLTSGDDVMYYAGEYGFITIVILVLITFAVENTCKKSLTIE